jgi:hypothetical protein
MDAKDHIEQTLAETLTEGDMQAFDPEDAAVDRLSPSYEIRQAAEQDPIVEETRIIRSMAQEIDDRYQSIDTTKRGR